MMPRLTPRAFTRWRFGLVLHSLAIGASSALAGASGWYFTR